MTNFLIIVAVVLLCCLFFLLIVGVAMAPERSQRQPRPMATRTKSQNSGFSGGL